MTSPVTPDRLQVKTALLQQIQLLDRQQALLPSPNPMIDAGVERLEALTAIAQPLQPLHWPSLLGTWTLIYASRGTVVTRRLDMARAPNVRLQQVWQTLTAQNHTLMAENGADIALPGLGSVRLQAFGIWIPCEEPRDDQGARVVFHRFTLQWRLPGLGWALPPLGISVPPAVRREALWVTSYLDGEVRVGRGATGNLFVFQRSGAALGAGAAAGHSK